MRRSQNSATAVRLLRLAGIAALFLVGVKLRGAETEKPPAWDLWPYRIRVIASVEIGGQDGALVEKELPEMLQARAWAVVGGMWKLKVTPATAELRRAIVHDLASIDEKALDAEALQSDKVILLGIGQTDGRFHVRAREFDVASGLWNGIVTLDVPQANRLAQESFRAVWTAFGPIARVEKVDGESVTLRLRGGALGPRGRPPAIPAGMAFRPVLIESDAQGAVDAGKCTPIEWTYLTVAEAAGSSLQCRLQSGLRPPVLPDYHPQRQRWAIGVSSSSSGTLLRLVTRGDDAEPLEGCDVSVADAALPGATAKIASLGRTNRRGEIRVPIGPHGVRTIEVRHGSELLARLPVVPGLTEELTLPLAFDRGRIALESALAQLADDVVDAAARREIWNERIRSAEQAGKAQDATAFRDQLRKAVEADGLLSRLDKLQQSLQSADAATRRRVAPQVAELRRAVEQLKATPTGK